MLGYFTVFDSVGLKAGRRVIFRRIFGIRKLLRVDDNHHVAFCRNDDPAPYFRLNGQWLRETLLEECRQRVAPLAAVALCRMKIRGEILADQFRVMSLEHFTEEVQDKYFARFEFLIAAYFTSK